MTHAAAPLPMSLLTSLPLPGEAAALPAMPGADPQTMAEAADFGAILAAMPVPMAPSTAEAGPAPMTEVSLPEAPEASVVPAPTLPDGGKILPVALPRTPTPACLEIPVAEEPSEGDAAPLVDLPEPARTIHALPELVTANLPSVLPIAVVPAAAAMPSASPDSEARDGSGSVAVPPVRPDSFAPPPVRIASQPSAETARPGFASGQPNDLPPAPATPLHVMPEQRTPQGQQLTALALLQEEPKRQATLPFAAISIRATTGLPSRDEAPVAGAFPVAFGTPLPSPVASPAQASPLPPPHDFAALVDRLTAARDAVQPHSVSVALSHADFGPVRIDFRHEDGALSVALASGDPGFAPAVAAAAPVLAAGTLVDTASSQSRSAEARQNEAGGQNPRGHSHPDRRDDRGPHTNPSPSRRGSRRDEAGSDIFA